MQIYRKSPLTGKTNMMDLDVTPAQLAELGGPRNRRPIQDIFPQLNAEQREFLLSGYTPEDWAKMFPPEKED